MDEKIQAAIELLVTQAGRPGSAAKPDEALKLTQAALNLAQLKQLLKKA